MPTAVFKQGRGVIGGEFDTKQGDCKDYGFTFISFVLKFEIMGKAMLAI